LDWRKTDVDLTLEFLQMSVPVTVSRALYYRFMRAVDVLLSVFERSLTDFPWVL
jgi:hypothetical protein